MFKADYEIPYYKTSIKLDERGDLKFIDLNSKKTYSISAILDRSILCNGISYGEFSLINFGISVSNNGFQLRE